MKFFQQQLNDLRLTKKNIPELVSMAYFKKFGLYYSSGDSLAFYSMDYIKVRDFAISEFNLVKFDEITKEQFLEAIHFINPKIIRYLNPTSLALHKLDINKFNLTGNLSILGEDQIESDSKTEDKSKFCFVIKDGTCYIAPKILAKPQINDLTDEANMGVHHSSLSGNGKVSYAGNIHRHYFPNLEKFQWVLDNQSGHYKTRIFHIMTALNTLHDAGMDLSKLIVYLKISSSKNLSIIEYANQLYERMIKSDHLLFSHPNASSLSLFDEEEKASDHQSEICSKM